MDKIYNAICVTKQQQIVTDLSLLTSHLPLAFEVAPHILQLCNTIASSAQPISVICFDTTELFSNSSMNIFDIVSLVQTFCKASNQPIPPIMAYVDETSSPSYIEQILDSDIKGLAPATSLFGVDSLTISFSEVLAGRLYMPRKLVDWFLQPHKLRQHMASSAIKLSKRQSQVLHLITTRGASNKVIARALHISESTVKLHIGAILKKYGVRNRTQLALCSLGNGRM